MGDNGGLCGDTIHPEQYEGVDGKNSNQEKSARFRCHEFVIVPF